MFFESTEYDAKRAASDRRITPLFEGFMTDPLGRARSVAFSMGVIALPRADRLRACRAAIGLMVQADRYVPDLIPTLFDYLGDDEVAEIRNDLENRRFFAREVPELAEAMTRSDIPEALWSSSAEMV